MNARTVMNGAARILAAMTALAFAMLALIGSAFASDAGNLKAGLMALAVFVLGGSVSLWVFLCSLSPASMASCLPARPALRLLLVWMPVYAAALAGAAAVIWATARS
jgi:hypothetical protein